ncbi:hypothetical protein HID58_066531 [Brassica napus]|uniref:Glutaredoxin domain-containing protein n=1 Tax=Brassica napus TaxID=3708 RepID=A0ABQ7ZFX1_BRANA|nr:hypothetical protein HID58_066531 [Brassica napus]
MGCVSSNLLNQSDDFSQLAGCHHHFVQLTSSTYGLLNLDPPPPPSSSVISAPATPMTPPERFTFVGKEPITVKSEPEVINFWELMSGLDADTCRFSPLPKLCPPGDGGDNRVVIYTTSLRGVRRTFDACNAVRAAIESFGVVICERDISMDRGFREELTSLMSGEAVLPPRVFVKGRYIGGVDEVMNLVEEGMLRDLLSGIPRRKDRGGGCYGCGGLSFLPCSECNGSCKVVEGWGSDVVVVRCNKCNENGLVLCPICS